MTAIRGNILLLTQRIFLLTEVLMFMMKTVISQIPLRQELLREGLWSNKHSGTKAQRNYTFKQKLSVSLILCVKECLDV